MPQCHAELHPSFPRFGSYCGSGLVTLANVIRLEHTSAVSHITYRNPYQFSLHSDSDTMTTLRMTRIAASTSKATPFWPAKCPPTPFSRSNPPPPSPCGTDKEGEASDLPSPRGVVRPSSTSHRSRSFLSRGPPLQPPPPARAPSAPPANMTAPQN